ncbi:hypothetical protein IGK74_002483 [Enterococcus sp. AZ150]|uniref:WxL domain-containing protein n=1 Tax=Enterococcus sp. AZ150 TaxID=2774866 RepID=UPI003F21264B
MKKNLVCLSSLLVLGGSIGMLSVQAEEASYTSQGSVTFEQDTSKTDPVDPLNPDKPVIPTDPDGNEIPDKGTAGPLSLDFASDFLFGTQKITTTDQDYYAKLQSYKKEGETTLSTGPNYIQVTDKRGTQLGWSLSVTQQEQFKTADEEVLEGAVIAFNNATAVSSVDSAYAPTINAGGATELKLVPGSQQPVMTAAEKQGMGTWLYRLGDETTADKSVKLSIPGKSVKLAKEYTTTLTWTLASTPTNP